MELVPDIRVALVQGGQGGMDGLPKVQVGRRQERAQVFHIMEPVLFRTEQITVHPGVGEIGYGGVGLRRLEEFIVYLRHR
jgi:hypothetical protein